jgi:hypothetical protein
LPVTNKLTACLFEIISILFPGKVKIGCILRWAGAQKSSETLASGGY